jgi:hypothetical protein
VFYDIIDPNEYRHALQRTGLDREMVIEANERRCQSSGTQTKPKAQDKTGDSIQA